MAAVLLLQMASEQLLSVPRAHDGEGCVAGPSQSLATVETQEADEAHWRLSQPTAFFSQAAGSVL